MNVESIMEESFQEHLVLAGKKLAYTGVPGSYAHEVLTSLLQYHERELGCDVTGVEIVTYPTHTDLVEAVSTGEVDMAVLPIENSIAGEVRDSVDLMHTKQVHINGEVQHKIAHNLLALPGARLKDITHVYSHEQALWQCSEFLEQYHWVKEPRNNTAVSAKYVSEAGDIHKAAIANEKAGNLYGLVPLARCINNVAENYTRFFVISREAVLLKGSEKISIITNTDNKSGALYELLGVIAKHGLNMVHIKSRPKVNTPWEYYFHIDFEGSLENPSVKEALLEIKEKSNYLQILGNYIVRKL